MRSRKPGEDEDDEHDTAWSVTKAIFAGVAVCLGFALGPGDPNGVGPTEFLTIFGGAFLGNEARQTPVARYVLVLTGVVVALTIYRVGGQSAPPLVGGILVVSTLVAVYETGRRHLARGT